MRHVGGPRRELGVRTVFNLLGPLTNPARPRAQLAGVGARHLGPLLAGAFALRKMTAMVVHSTEGIDELSPAGPSLAWLVQDGQVTETELSPADFGLPEHPLAAVAGGAPAENAATMRRVLGGEPGPMADFVTLNAGAALVVAGRAENYQQGATMARSALDGGAALLKLDEYIALTQELMA
jgi:anthranilate phosphoribosyltransferase